MKAQIEEAEQAIEAGDARRQNIRSDLSAKLRKQRKTLLIGTVLVVGLGLLLYPKRRILLHRMHRWMQHPLIQNPINNWILSRVPWAGVVLKIFRVAKPRDAA